MDEFEREPDPMCPKCDGQGVKIDRLASPLENLLTMCDCWRYVPKVVPAPVDAGDDDPWPIARHSE